MGKSYIIAKFQSTDLVICIHSREGKTSSQLPARPLIFIILITRVFHWKTWLIKVKTFIRNPYSRNGLIQIIRMHKFTGQKEIKQFMVIRFRSFEETQLLKGLGTDLLITQSRLNSSSRQKYFFECKQASTSVFHYHPRMVLI